MTEAPLVSVVVPVYNGDRFLAETLQSILDQDYEPLEVIVVDDGSTDSSSEVAQSLPVRYHYQDNAGPCVARNAGASMADGDFISFCDADDLFLPGRLRKQVAHLLDRSDLGCVLVRAGVFTESGVAMPEWLPEEEQVTWEAALVRRSVFESVGGFDPAYAPSEGFEWLARLKDAGYGIDVLPETLAGRRIHDRNIAHDREGRNRAMFEAVRDRMTRQREGE